MYIMKCIVLGKFFVLENVTYSFQPGFNADVNNVVHKTSGPRDQKKKKKKIK